MLVGKITIDSSGAKEIFDWVSNGAIREFEEYIGARISGTGISTHTTSVPTPVSVADELEKLSALMDKGILTAEEFEAQKRKLL